MVDSYKPMKINVTMDPSVDLTHSALQIWDFYYAYRQAMNQHQNYQANVEIKIDYNLPYEHDAINVGWFYMPTRPIDIDKFDVVIVDAVHHHFEVCNQEMYNAVTSLDNCYYICGSYVDAQHPFHDKIIWTPKIFNTCSYWVTNS